MIRLIACDIDGTLLQAGQETLPPAIHPLIRQLEERGVAFCVASGRQFSNLHALFGPSAGRIYYVCENGALVFGKGAPDRPLKKIVLTEYAMEIRKQLGEQIERTEEKLMEGFSHEEVDQLFSYIERLSRNLEKCL